MTPYNIWTTASGLNNTVGKESAFDADPEKDSLANGLEWILGGNPLAPSTAVLPQISVDETNISATFTRNDDSESTTALALQWSNALTGWTDVAIGADSSSPDANGVSVNVTENGSAPDTVVVTIPRSIGELGGPFVRLKAAMP